MKLSREKKIAVLLLFVLVSALCALSACSSQAANQVTDPGGAASSGATSWSVDADCAGCHVNEANPDSACLAYKHQAQGTGCTKCHDDEGALSEAHGKMNTASLPKRLHKTTVSNSACLSCHDQAELANATAGLTILTDSKGTVVNPHKPPVNDDHASGITCIGCHVMHVASDPLKAAPELCSSCHHAGVYECHTCHE